MSNNPYNAPGQPGVQPMQSAGTRSVCIKRFDVMSCGIMLGALYVFVGLIVGGIFFLFSLVGIAAGGGGEAAMGGLIGGVGAIILFPLIYGAMGFIGGIIGAVLYNLVAGVVGGIRMDLES
jgi:hypothetical protein